MSRDAADARPRVLHVGPDPRTEGGMPAVVRDLLTSPLSGAYRQSFLPTYRPQDLRGTIRDFPGVLRRLARFCLGRGPRLVHIHSAAKGSLYRKSLCTVVAWTLRRPVVVHVHSGGVVIDEFARRLGAVRRWLFARALGRADRVLSVSRAGAEELARHFGCRDVLVVPNAAPAVAPGPPPGAAGPEVLYLGGFTEPAKGGALLVEALDRIRELAPAARVTLAGPGEPAPAERAAIAAGGAEWVGWLDREAKHAALREAAVVVFPSLSEGLPVAFLEAMAYGRAILATRVGGMPEVAEDGVSARFVAPRDPEALASALAGLVGDAAECARLGAAARGRAERLTTREVAERLDALYRELLGEGAGVAGG